MKNIFLTLFVILTFITGSVVKSQNPARFPRIQERILQAKLHEIRIHLKLDQAAFDQFRPIYVRYEKEISGINIFNLSRMMRVNADSLSAEEADKLIVNHMAATKKLISIREKYYAEFRTVLSPQEVIKLYQTEAELRKKMLQEMKRRMISR